ncbi:MAG: GNAT family N-acetyltransferase [Phycisphaerales bacterium]|nr:GNAT family N-acetyltransferase [Phycisphaerales bacterium]
MSASSDWHDLRRRFLGAHWDVVALRSELVECVGSFRDYKHLARFHYKSGMPASVMRVLTLRHRSRSLVGRYLGRTGEDALVGVLVVSLPSPACMMRDVATGNRYRGLGVRVSLRLLNREVRTISRVVIDPQWRGLGLAVRLVERALAEAEQPYTEALAAMGRVHPFFERAGMRRYDRPQRVEHQRLLDALEALGIEPWELASRRRVAARIADDKQAADLLLRELRRWSGCALRRRAGPAAHRSMGSLLAEARDHLLCQPVYYLHRTQEAETKEVLSLEKPHREHRTSSGRASPAPIEREHAAR